MKTKQEQNISLTDAVSPAYKKFFDKFKQIETLETSKWEPAHIIGYFCKLYLNYYKVSYTFKFKNIPSKSYEIYRLRELANMISSNPIILKDYIDWFFEKKIIAKKKRITSMAFLTDTIVVNEYKFSKLLIDKSKPINRAESLPTIYKNIIYKYNDAINTYGDLSFLKMTLGPDTDPKYYSMMEELKIVGLNIELLDRVK
jgi:hypothetical protein